MDENINDFEEEELNNIIILSNEDGEDVKFEFLDLIEYDSEEYVILLPIDEEGTESEEDGEIVILKVEDTESDEESYVSVDDEDVLNSVFEIFKEKFKDEFNFTDAE